MTAESWEKFFICEIVKNRKKYNLNEKKRKGQCNVERDNESTM